MLLLTERDQDHHEDVTVAAEADHHDVATEGKKSFIYFYISTVFMC